MPQWLVIVLGVFAGLAIVGGALTLAFLPEFRPKKGRKSRLAEPSGNVDNYPYGYPGLGDGM